MSEKHMPKAFAGQAAVLAERYALALLQLAEEKGQTDSVLADLDVLEQTALSDPLFRVASMHPRFHADGVYESLIDNIVKTAKFCSLTAGFLRRVAKGRRLFLLSHMIDAFRAQLSEKRGLKTAYVSTALPLTEGQKTALASHLSALAGGKVDLVVSEDKNLLGGFMVKMGSRLIDATVNGKLVQIERQLKAKREAA